MLKIIGILLVLGSIGYTAWWMNKESNNKTTKSCYMYGVVPLCALAVLSGFCLLFYDRITELTINNVGTIITSVQADANTVATLTKRVEGQSATVDLVAKEASQTKKISEEVASKNKQAEEKLISLDEAISKVNATLANLDAMKEFTMTVMAAENDDRLAFYKLRSWSGDGSYSLQKQAIEAVMNIEKSYVGICGQHAFLELTWSEGSDPSKLSFEEIKSVWQGSC